MKLIKYLKRMLVWISVIYFVGSSIVFIDGIRTGKVRIGSQKPGDVCFNPEIIEGVLESLYTGKHFYGRNLQQDVAHGLSRPPSLENPYLIVLAGQDSNCLPVSVSERLFREYGVRVVGEGESPDWSPENEESMPRKIWIKQAALAVYSTEISIIHSSVAGIHYNLILIPRLYGHFGRIYWSGIS